MQAKYELLNRSGVLSYVHDTAKFADVGGLERLKAWLHQRKPAFDGSAPNLDPPKGLLLLGVQGCGKSLAARAAAGIFATPLLRLDFGAVYNKWHGESERNLRDTLRTAELMAPCVLWIDEIEKESLPAKETAAPSRRALGTFLTWLAEKRSPVFVVATANDIAALPPELIRKGRFDEIFFVDLPSSSVRQEILAIHAKRRGLDLHPWSSNGSPQSAMGSLVQSWSRPSFLRSTTRMPRNSVHRLRTCSGRSRRPARYPA